MLIFHFYNIFYFIIYFYFLFYHLLKSADLSNLFSYPFDTTIHTHLCMPTHTPVHINIHIDIIVPKYMNLGTELTVSYNYCVHGYQMHTWQQGMQSENFQDGFIRTLHENKLISKWLMHKKWNNENFSE